MATVVVESESVKIPAWVENLDAFRQWARSDDFPEHGRICFFHGEVWVDMSKEQLFTHNQVKTEITAVLHPLAKSASSRYFSDGCLLTNGSAGLSTNPDGVFVSKKSLASCRVELVEGLREGYLEIEGTPDMVLEVVSTSSVEKDTEILRELYWRAGIAEYWLVDARGDPLEFDVLRHSAKGYAATRKQAGWSKSTVFGRSFKLSRHTDALGHPEYTLHVR